MKLSNKIFYLRHDLELKKYMHNRNSLHIVNSQSIDKIFNQSDNIVYLDLNNLNNLENLKIKTRYERIILTDVVENHHDLYSLLIAVQKLLENDGKLIMSSLNTKYFFIAKIFEKFKLKDSYDTNSYINIKKVNRISNGVGLEYQKYYTKQIFPFKLFYFGNILNKFLETLLFRFNFGIKSYMIFRPISEKKVYQSKSIIIPAKNEEGNLEELISRIPNFENTEIIFAYGKSHDKTLNVMQEIMNSNKNFKFKLIKQTKTGKANAVWEALRLVENDLIAILDADISVEPELLNDFFEIIENNRSDFVNGTRLIYDMEKNSMRFLNKLGNRFFQFFISRIIKESLTDSLCGTKIFKRSNLNDLYFWQKHTKLIDPFGDFDLLFSAAFMGQKIVELPVNYKERKYGQTQISRFRDGFKLLKYLLRSFIVFNTSRNDK
tara:strand:+ start:497 stop:1801 length:1305 start_codon:yes stop_codon:yes gene_type:complete